MKKEDNSFKIIKYRLKLGDDNILLVQGWFVKNDIGNEKIVFLLGDKCLPFRMTVKEGIEIRKKHLAESYGVDREYYFWIQLPKKINSNQVIRIFEKNKLKSRLVYVVPCKNIIKLKNRVDMYIEKPQKNGEITSISGWYAAQLGESVKIIILDDKHRKVHFEINERYRPDVILEYPDSKKEEVHGFQINILDHNINKISILLKSGNKISKYSRELSPNLIKRNIIKFYEILNKAYFFFVNNGIKKNN